MHTIVLVSINIRGYYSTAIYLLTNYALADEELSANFDIKLIDEGIVYNRKKRLYKVCFFEYLKDFLFVARKRSIREIFLWSKLQLKYNRFFLDVLEKIHWWWILCKIVIHRPLLVGFSCYVWNVVHVTRMGRLIKRLLPKTIIIAGGQEVTNSAQEFLAQCPWFDGVVDGEGEETFKEILKSILHIGPHTLTGIPGLAAHKDSPPVARALITPLSSIPSPYGRFFKNRRLLQQVRRSRLGCMVETARGCPFKCGFCFESDKYNTVRYFPESRVADEIICMVHCGVRDFHILDPVLCNSDAERVAKIRKSLEEVAQFGIHSFTVEVYAELLTPDIVKNLTVFNTFDVGLQSCSPVVLKKIKRYFNETKFVQGIHLLEKLHKTIAIYLIFGLPGESYFSFIKSIRFALSLQPTKFFINQLCVLSGTPLKKNAQIEGLRFDSLPPYYVRATAQMSFDEINLLNCMSLSLITESWPFLEMRR